MPRQGGQGKGKPKLQDRNFGQALVRSQINKVVKKDKQVLSILDNSSLDDYILTAEMDANEAEVIRPVYSDVKLIEPMTRKPAQSNTFNGQIVNQQLSIPRKPKWTASMTAEEIDRQETDAFLQWRRDLAAAESASEHLKLTPFEKNLDVWRQLWRVVERCDMLVQIVDARNPLFYYSKDLKSYVENIYNRPMILLVNKADFLTDYQRTMWAMKFREQKIPFVFYSAKIETIKIESSSIPKTLSSVDDKLEAIREENDNSENEDDYEDEDDCGDDDNENEGSDDEVRSEMSSKNEVSSPLDVRTAQIAEHKSLMDEFLVSLATEIKAQMSELVSPLSSKIATHSSADADVDNSASTSITTSATVLIREELIQLFDELPLLLSLSPQPKHSGRICVGMVGFPNVGKSSVMNSLLNVKKNTHGHRASVSSTPGRTKHMQTFLLSESLILCDCPGLVFPSFMSNVGDMLCAGVLPINNMRDYEEAASAIACRIPKHILEATYGINIKKELDLSDSPDRPPTAYEILAAYCFVKGYITNGTGRWDEFRATKELLRDYNDGRLLYVTPPEIALCDAGRWMLETEKTTLHNERTLQRLARQQREAESAVAKSRGPNGVSNELEWAVDEDEVHAGSGKREHKRLKTWGKKGKKLRNKDPYGDGNKDSFVAFFKNKSNSGLKVR